MNRSCFHDKLFLVNDIEQFQKDMYKFCFERIQSGNQYVLLFTNRRPNLLPLVEEEKISKELLKRLIIMLVPTIDCITRKLLELHDWALLPDLLIVDLQPFVAFLPGPEREEKSPLQTICLCIATLFNFMDFIATRLEKLTAASADKNAHRSRAACSLVLLPAQCLTQTQLDLLINLYFYKNNAFDDFAELCEKR